MIVFKLILVDMGCLEWEEVEIINKFSWNMLMGILVNCKWWLDFKMRFVNIFM